MLGFLSLLLVFIPEAVLGAGSKRMAVTFDGFPRDADGAANIGKAQEIFKRVFDECERRGVKAVFFMAKRVLYGGQKELLDDLLKRGHVLGNHTVTHGPYRQLSSKAYQKEIIWAEDKFRPWLGGRKYFRPPELDVGENASKRMELLQFLGKRGYRLIPATLRSADFRIGVGYAKARNVRNVRNDEEQLRIGKDYMAHFKSRMNASIGSLFKKYGRHIPHILLVHVNLLNAEYLHEILSWFRAEGWEFVTLDKALEDSVYKFDYHCHGDCRVPFF